MAETKPEEQVEVKTNSSKTPEPSLVEKKLETIKKILDLGIDSPGITVIKEEPKLFQRYGIGSPSLGHQDFALLKDQTFLKNIENLKDVKIYIEYASLEGEPHKSGVESFVEIIKTNKSIEWKKFVIDGSHLAANPTSCVKALSYLYAKER